jgi:hypothetical protein
MKRTASGAVVAALAVMLALSGAVAAKDHPAHGKATGHVATTGTAAKAAKATSLRTKGNASHPGGVFRVLAVVKASPADRPATINAIVHFASGDVSVVLTRSGGGSAYHASVPVPAAEPAGTVLIDATAVVAPATLTATGSGKIVVGDTAGAPDAAETPDTAETPEAPKSADVCTTPPLNQSPESSDAPESPESSDAPELSDAPKSSDLNTGDSSPDADEASDTCGEGDAPSLTLSAATVARLVAFLESLFA